MFKVIIRKYDHTKELRVFYAKNASEANKISRRYVWKRNDFGELIWLVQVIKLDPEGLNPMTQ